MTPYTGETERLAPQPQPTMRPAANLDSPLWLFIGAIVSPVAFSQGALIGICAMLALFAVALIASQQEGL